MTVRFGSVRFGSGGKRAENRTERQETHLNIVTIIGEFGTKIFFFIFYFFFYSSFFILRRMGKNKA